MPYQSGRGLEELAAFVAVVDANGFSAAARRAGVRKATLSQRLRDLEGRLGVSLLVRTTRALRLTEEGHAYFEHAKRCVASAQEADAVVTRSKAVPSGTLRITLPSFLGPRLLADILSRYGERYPNVRLEVSTTSAIVDLGREEYDVALRVGQLASSTLVSIRLGSVNAGYFAAPKYLEKRGLPTLAAIAEHAAISTRGRDGHEMWPFWVDGREKRVLITPHVVVDDCAMAVRAARSALGIVYAPFACAVDAVESGDLQQVLIEATPPALPISAVLTAGASGVPRVAALLDMLKEWFHAHGRQI